MTFVFPLYRTRRFILPLPSLELLSKFWVSAEVAITFSLLFYGLWGNVSRNRIAFYGLVWLLATTWLDLGFRRCSLKRLGLVWNRSKDSTWVIYTSVLIASCILISGLVSGKAHGDYVEAYLLKKTEYVVFALYQRFLDAYILVRIEKRLRRSTPLAMSALFAFAHAPNWKLMLIASVSEYASALIFRRCRNLYAMAAAHAILGAALPAFWKLDMRVGKGYLLPRKP